MLIIADRAIPFARMLLEPLGQLRLVEAGDLDRNALDGADVLVVRSVTRVDAKLLGGTGVRFVATATSGTDHVDVDWLNSNGVGFAAAAGCNATAVAEYVLSALCVLDSMGGLDLARIRVGIIGAGHVGGCLAAMLEALEVPVLLNDPPLAAATGDSRYRPLAELLKMDVLSFHVPLADAGAYPTRGLLGSGLLARLLPESVLINTSRGAVCDEAALIRHLERNPGAAAVVDVWANEPAFNLALLRRAALATTHVAGYSLDARLRAVCMVRDAIRGYFSLAGAPVREPELPVPATRIIRLVEWDSELDAVRAAVLAAYDVRSDAAPLRRAIGLNDGERARLFSDLRANHAYRREFPAYRVEIPGVPSSLARRLRAVGFEVADVG